MDPLHNVCANCDVAIFYFSYGWRHKGTSSMFCSQSTMSKEAEPKYLAIASKTIKDNK